MLVYLLKFSACLAIFMVFYKLFLERENMHHIKRYYLLAAIFIALSIPLITFTTYIEPAITSISEIQTFQNFNIQTEIVEAPTNYLPAILWSIYGLGVTLFGMKFILNLSRILFKINRNPKHKAQDFTHVLLCDLITPHTFFSYIFLNKNKFETQQIPREVFIHEEAHATQKHSIDILVIELLQIVFWFNPLVYFTKRSIKMNHEFLADEAVLKHGIEPSIYQKLLLTFSSNVTEPQLANAINYSSIKKRFTVMKTHTSKQKIWLRSFLLLPLVALTLYGFSETKIVEKEILINASFFDSIDFYLNENGELLLGETIITLEEIEEMYKENNDLYISIKAFPNVDSEIVQKTVQDLRKIGFKKMTYCTSGDTAQPNTDEQRKEMMESLLKVRKQQKATPEEVAEYNKLAKHYNSQTDDNRVIKLKDMKRLRELYDKMTKEQSASAEPLPNFPPPPPPTKESSQVVLMHDLPPPPPIPANATLEEKKTYQKTIDNYKRQKEGYKYKHKNKDGKLVDVMVITDGDEMVHHHHHHHLQHQKQKGIYRSQLDL